MLSLIIGGSASGKSQYAERKILELNKSSPICYLATMKVYGLEGIEKVRRHRLRREGKGFFTIEKDRDISIVPSILRDNHKSCNSLLLECMSNLVANEMFIDDKVVSKEIVVSKILNDIECLYESLENLIIVTGNVFEDGNTYLKETIYYMEALAELNRCISKNADEIIEMVVGIPIRIK